MKKNIIINIILLAALVFTFVACGSNGAGPGDPTGGLTITGLGDFEGQYVVAIGDGTVAAISLTGTNPSNISITGGKIVGGQVTMSVWHVDGTPYTGSHTTTFYVFIKESNPFVFADLGDLDSPNFKGDVTVTFTNGTGSGILVPEPARGLTITGLEAFEGEYVVALGEAGPLPLAAYVRLYTVSYPDSLNVSGARVIDGKATLSVGTAATAPNTVTPYTGSDTAEFFVFIRPTNEFSMEDGDIGGEQAIFYEGTVKIAFTDGVGSGEFAPSAKVIDSEWRRNLAPLTTGRFQADEDDGEHPIYKVEIGADTITMYSVDFPLDPVELDNVYTRGGGEIINVSRYKYTYVYQNREKIGFILSFTANSIFYYQLYLGYWARNNAVFYEPVLDVDLNFGDVPLYPALWAAAEE